MTRKGKVQSLENKIEIWEGVKLAVMYRFHKLAQIHLEGLPNAQILGVKVR